MQIQIQRRGRWLYGDTVFLPVDIVSLDFDFWYEIGKTDDRLEPGEEPGPFDEHGLMYYYRFRHAGEHTLPTWVDSPGRATIDESMHEAEDRAPTPIEWE